MPLFAHLIGPAMILLNATPHVILAPVFVIWLGIDLASKVALAFILVAVLIFFAVYSGIKEVDQRLVERVRTLGGGRRVLIRDRERAAGVGRTSPCALVHSNRRAF